MDIRKIIDGLRAKYKNATQLCSVIVTMDGRVIQQIPRTNFKVAMEKVEEVAGQYENDPAVVRATCSRPIACRNSTVSGTI